MRKMESIYQSKYKTDSLRKKWVNSIPLLEFQNVSMSYGDLQVFKDFNLTLNQGETVGLTGPSGCGKSTVLRIAVDLVTPTAGEVTFHEMPVSEWDPIELRRKMILVPQEASMFPGTVRDNLQWALDIHHLEHSESEFEEVLSNVLLDIQYLDKIAANLSGGQKQRVAIARALLLKPDVLLLDEPTSALDTDATLAVEESINNMIKASDLSVLIVTHNKAQAERFTSRVIEME